MGGEKVCSPNVVVVVLEKFVVVLEKGFKQEKYLPLEWTLRFVAL